MRGIVCVLIVLLAFACNGGEEAPRTATPAASPSATPQATATATPTAVPTAVEYPPKVSLTERGVYLIRPDGTGLRNLTPGEEARYGFRWSPDGSRIAIVARRGDGGRVSVTDVDGAAELTVFDGSGRGPEWWIGSALWSPDGRKLAVDAGPYGEPYPTAAGWHTYLVNVDGSGEPIDLFEGLSEEWSPDGSALAFAEYSDKGIALQICDLGTGVATVIERFTSLFYSAWSPDSQRLAYSMYPQDATLEEVVIIDRDGGNRRVIAEHGSDPQWSPDGKYLVFRDASGSLNVVQVSTSADPVPLAPGRVLRWSPEQDAILLWREGSLNLVSLTTHETIETIDVTGDVLPTGQVSLSPDGQRVTFAGCEPSPPAPCSYPGDLFVANADGTGLEKLVKPSTGIPWGPEWSPDGRYIAFVDGMTQIS